MVSPQLQRGLLDLVYFTWLHNAEAIAYFVGILLTLGLLFLKPKRTTLLFFWGFLVLLVQFQYVKHIVEPLEAQTMQTVLQRGASGLRFQRLTSFGFQKVIPFGLYFVGWGSIFLSILSSATAQTNKKSK